MYEKGPAICVSITSTTIIQIWWLADRMRSGMYFVQYNNECTCLQRLLASIVHPRRIQHLRCIPYASHPYASH